MSLIFATQLTAVATAVLAVFAVLTAVFAGLAFRKQSQEVKDEQELLEVQSGQLEVQRRQLEEQREINELQIKDLRESLRAAEREQADNIDFQMSAMPFPRYVDDADEDFAAVADQEVHLAIVSNESRRPIKNVKCRIGGAPCPEIPDAHSPFAVVVGRLAASEPGERRGPRVLINPVPRSSARWIRPGETYGLVFETSSHRALDLVDVAVRFTDDAGLRWQIDRDLHLERSPDHDW
jgi:hypothetical protein